MHSARCSVNHGYPAVTVPDHCTPSLGLSLHQQEFNEEFGRAVCGTLGCFPVPEDQTWAGTGPFMAARFWVWPLSQCHPPGSDRGPCRKSQDNFIYPALKSDLRLKEQNTLSALSLDSDIQQWKTRTDAGVQWFGSCSSKFNEHWVLQIIWVIKPSRTFRAFSVWLWEWDPKLWVSWGPRFINCMGILNRNQKSPDSLDWNVTLM